MILFKLKLYNVVDKIFTFKILDILILLQINVQRILQSFTTYLLNFTINFTFFQTIHLIFDLFSKKILP